MACDGNLIVIHIAIGFTLSGEMMFPFLSYSTVAVKVIWVHK